MTACVLSSLVPWPSRLQFFLSLADHAHTIKKLEPGERDNA